MAKLARCPFARWDPDGATPGKSMTPTQVILHVTTVERDSQSHDGLEWHFEIDYDGNIEQSVLCNRQAAANYKANVRAISIETWGKGEGEWTAKQIEAIIKLLRWLNAEWNIPLTPCPRWDAPGIGYHIMFGSPGMWTNVAKSCPGPKRIEQFKKILVPRLANVEIEPVRTEDEIMSDIIKMFLVYLGITEDEIMNSQDLREQISLHTWQVLEGIDGTTMASKRRDLEAWARAQRLYPAVPSPGWWK